MTPRRISSIKDLQDVIAFFRSVQGCTERFRFKDWAEEFRFKDWGDDASS